MLLTDENQLYYSIGATHLGSYSLPVLATENKTSLIPYIIVETVNDLQDQHF